MKMTAKFLTIPALLLSLGAAPVLAQGAASAAAPAAQQTQDQKSPVSLVLTQQLVTTVRGADGKTTERLNPDASRVRPGDIIEYGLTAKNITRDPVTGVLPMLPVPAGATFVSAAGGTGTEYSYDGGKTYGKAPLYKTVTVQENGKAVTKKVEVKPSEYTNVRWNVGTLRAGQQQKLSLRVRVS